MPERRQQYMVQKFQHRLVIRILAYWVVYQFTQLNVLFCWRLLEGDSGSFGEQYSRFLGEFYPLLFSFAVLIPFFLWDSVKFYHRIAGPLNRFQSAFREVVEKRPVRKIKLRNTDELHDMQDALNAMLEDLAKRGVIELVEGGKDKKTSNESNQQEPFHAST